MPLRCTTKHENWCLFSPHPNPFPRGERRNYRFNLLPYGVKGVPAIYFLIKGVIYWGTGCTWKPGMSGCFQVTPGCFFQYLRIENDDFLSPDGNYLLFLKSGEISNDRFLFHP